MRYPFTFTHTDAFYEVAFRHYAVSRITRYWGGLRQNLEYDDLPDAVKQKVLDELERRILRDEEDDN